LQYYNGRLVGVYFTLDRHPASHLCTDGCIPLLIAGDHVPLNYYFFNLIKILYMLTMKGMPGILFLKPNMFILQNPLIEKLLNKNFSFNINMSKFVKLYYPNLR